MKKKQEPIKRELNEKIQDALKSGKRLEIDCAKIVKADEYEMPPFVPGHIDVDGAELDVLEGAQETVRSPQLESLLVESDADGAIPGSISTQLEDAGLALAAVHEIREIIGTPVTTVKNYLYRRS